MKAIITGSSRGIGAAIAKEFSRRGHFYYGFSRWNDVDVSSYESIQEAFETMIPNDDIPEVLVNNAGIIKLGSILELDVEDWQEQINVNLNGVFYCCKEYARIAKKRGGKIINIASTAGMSARPGRSCYSATKAAVINFSQSISEELKDYNIQVYCVCPGAVNTDLRKQVNPDDDFIDMLQPMDVAKFVVDIAEGGKYLDNQSLILRKNF